MSRALLPKIKYHYSIDKYLFVRAEETYLL